MATLSTALYLRRRGALAPISMICNAWARRKRQRSVRRPHEWSIDANERTAQLSLFDDMGFHNGAHGHLGGAIHSVFLRVAQWRYCRRDICLHRRICWILPG